MGYDTQHWGQFTTGRLLTEQEVQDFNVLLEKLPEVNANWDTQWELIPHNTSETWPEKIDREPIEHCLQVNEDDYSAYHWLEELPYLLKEFFVPRGIILNGDIEWSGDESDDIGKVIIKDNAMEVYYHVDILDVLNEMREHYKKTIEEHTAFAEARDWSGYESPQEYMDDTSRDDDEETSTAWEQGYRYGYITAMQHLKNKSLALEVDAPVSLSTIP